MKTLPPYLKRFGAWVTALTDNYRFNPFTKATVHIIVILTVFAALFIGISWWSIQYAQSNTVGTIRNTFQQAAHGLPQSVNSLPEAIHAVRNQTVAYAFIGFITLIIIFGVLLVRFALSPTKASLQLQKRFIGNIAHEIRTPLAVIKTTTEVLLLDPKLSSSLRAPLEDTILELNRISDTINNLLTFDALMQPRYMKTQPVDMAKIATTVIDRTQDLATSRGISLSLTSCTKSIAIGNPMALEQVVTNLVKNAINYTHPHTHTVRYT